MPKTQTKRLRLTWSEKIGIIEKVKLSPYMSYTEVAMWAMREYRPRRETSSKYDGQSATNGPGGHPLYQTIYLVCANKTRQLQPVDEWSCLTARRNGLSLLARCMNGIMRDKALRDVREEQQELEALHRLDEECSHQQRAGNYLKAFDCMERALVLRRQFFGIESEEVIQACRALAEMCNLLAMSFLLQDNYAVTIDLLKKAEVLTQRHHPVERATTLNNLACYYRRLGKLHAAMTSLKRALELEKRLENVRNAADTQLNMCAILSQLGKHEEALERAQEALITLQEGFIRSKHTTDTTTETTTADTSSSRLDRISVMCIAYHNVGVEQEFLKDYAESVSSYKKGIGLAEQYLGTDHSITTTIRNSYLAAKRTLATKAQVRTCSASRRDQKSPGKTGSRLLLSPRSGPLRMPSPLAKGKDRHSGPQIPTPRSIVADALSRAPISALPPLEMQSPSSASKKRGKTEPSEVKRSAPQLSPTDPFFSPRFKFDSSSSEGKSKKLASITVARSPSVGASVEGKAPPSSKGKQRKKSSVKKSPATAETDEKVAKSCHEERMETAPTPQSSEETGVSQDVLDVGTSTNDIAPHSSREGVAAESSAGADLEPYHSGEQIESVLTSNELSVKENELKSSSRSEHPEERVIKSDHDQLKDGGGNGQMKLVPAEYTDLSATNNGAIAISEVENVDTATTSTISTLLTNLIELVAEQETNLLSKDFDSAEDTCSTNVKQVPEGETLTDDTYYDDHTFSSGGNNVELRCEKSGDHDASRIVEVGGEEKPNSLNEFEAPGEAITEVTADVFVSKDFDMNTAEPFEVTTEEAYTGPNQATEASSVSSEDVIGTEDLNAEKADQIQINEIAAELEPEVTCNTNEELSHFQDGEIVELNQAVHEEIPELQTEDNDDPVFVDEEQTPPSAGEEETMGHVMDNDLHDNEDSQLETPENFESSLHGAEQAMESTNADELEGQKEESFFSNDAEQFASALFQYETLELTSSDTVYYMNEENDISLEQTTPDFEASEYVYDEAQQRETDVRDNDPLVYQTEHVISDYEQQEYDYEDAVNTPSDTAGQDWSHAEQAEPAAMEATTCTEYGDYPQETPVLLNEELWDGHAEIPDNHQQDPYNYCAPFDASGVTESAANVEIGAHHGSASRV